MSSRLFAVSQLFLALFIVIAAEEAEQFRPIKYKTCKASSTIVSVEAIGCSGGDNRCIFYHNSEPLIRIGFKPDQAVSQLRTLIMANLGDAKGPITKFHLENDNACEGNNITCPLKAGQTYYYSQPVRILKEYPTVDVQVNWMLLNPDVDPENLHENLNSRYVCIKFLATVKEA